jgi:hypothetical protein
MDHEIRIRFEEEPQIPVVEVIAEFIVNFCEERGTAVSTMGTALLMIMKGTTPEQWDEVQKKTDITKVDTKDAVKLIKSWGKEFPFIQINDKDGEVRINYQRQLVLDFRDPHFFDHLEQVLLHSLEQSDLSRFSLRG